MTVLYVNTILAAVKTVFISMLGMSVKFTNPTLKNSRQSKYEISSRISLTGKFNHLIVLSYPAEVAKAIASEMLGETFNEINDELIDAIGEITNMIAGVADTELEIENVTYSLPTVTIDNNKIVYPKGSDIFSMECIMDAGNFEVDIAFDKDSLL